MELQEITESLAKRLESLDRAINTKKAIRGQFLRKLATVSRRNLEKPGEFDNSMRRFLRKEREEFVPYPTEYLAANDTFLVFEREREVLNPNRRYGIVINLLIRTAQGWKLVTKDAKTTNVHIDAMDAMLLPLTKSNTMTGLKKLRTDSTLFGEQFMTVTGRIKEDFGISRMHLTAPIWEEIRLKQSRDRQAEFESQFLSRWGEDERKSAFYDLKYDALERRAYDALEKRAHDALYGNVAQQAQQARQALAHATFKAPYGTDLEEYPQSTTQKIAGLDADILVTDEIHETTEKETMITNNKTETIATELTDVAKKAATVVAGQAALATVRAFVINAFPKKMGLLARMTGKKAAVHKFLNSAVGGFVVTASVHTFFTLVTPQRTKLLAVTRVALDASMIELATKIPYQKMADSLADQLLNNEAAAMLDEGAKSEKKQ